MSRVRKSTHVEELRRSLERARLECLAYNAKHNVQDAAPACDAPQHATVDVDAAVTEAHAMYEDEPDQRVERQPS